MKTSLARDHPAGTSTTTITSSSSSDGQTLTVRFDVVGL